MFKFLTSYILYSYTKNLTILQLDNKQTWIETNDPVMGGESTGEFYFQNNSGVFTGNCVDVPFLKAPGFCKVTTHSQNGYFKNISNYLDKGISLMVKTNTSNYQGFRFAFTAKDIPHTSIFGGGSFKAGFSKYLDNSDNWQIVTIPFDEFSYDWSSYSGQCNSTDPNGQQHHCCSNIDNKKYCPKTKYLDKITGFELWAEGNVGKFFIKLNWIGIIL